MLHYRATLICDSFRRGFWYTIIHFPGHHLRTNSRRNWNHGYYPTSRQRLCLKTWTIENQTFAFSISFLSISYFFFLIVNYLILDLSSRTPFTDKYKEELESRILPNKPRTIMTRDWNNGNADVNLSTRLLSLPLLLPSLPKVCKICLSVCLSCWLAVCLTDCMSVWLAGYMSVWQ